MALTATTTQLSWPPKTNLQFKKDRQYVTVKNRPLPASRLQLFGQVFVQHSWREVLECEDGHQKAENFHTTLVSLLDKNFSQKNVNLAHWTESG